MGTSQGCWAVIAATPIMRWAQSLESPHNVTFVDSTSSCDAGGSTATLLLMGTKAGAMPADALVHSSQTREGYRAAFQLPKYIHHASVTKRLCSSVPSLRGLLNLLAMLFRWTHSVPAFKRATMAKFGSNYCRWLATRVRHALDTFAGSDVGYISQPTSTSVGHDAAEKMGCLLLLHIQVGYLKDAFCLKGDHFYLIAMSC